MFSVVHTALSYTQMEYKQFTRLAAVYRTQIRGRKGHRNLERQKFARRNVSLERKTVDEMLNDTILRPPYIISHKWWLFVIKNKKKSEGYF